MDYIEIFMFFGLQFCRAKLGVAYRQEREVEYNSVEIYNFCFLVLFSCECDSVEGQKLGLPSFSGLCVARNTQPLHRKKRGYIITP